MQNKQNNINTPAFPPQLMQDNFGQIVALVPGLTKLEYTAIHLFPKVYDLWNEGHFKTTNTKVNNQYEACVKMAKILLETIEKDTQNEENKLQIV